MILKFEKVISTGFYFLIFSVFIPLLFFTIGLLMDNLLGSTINSSFQFISYIGVIITSGGLIILTLAVHDLWFKGGGLPASSVPPVKFVKDGIYGFCRHPIYSGAALIFAGISLLNHSFWNLILTFPLFVIFFSVYAITIEEPVLVRRFGEEYIQYQKETPLMFPVSLPGILKRIIIAVLMLISRIVNRPFIVKYKQHLFFLGYGFWCGSGILFGLMLLNLLLLYLGAGKLNIQIILLAITFLCLFGTRLIWMIGTLIYSKKNLKTVMGQVGFVSWGVLAGDLLCGVVFIFITGMSYLIWLDVVFFSQMLTHFFGRIGCLFYGCCYGKETCSEFFIQYKHPALKAVREGRIDTGKIIPVQLFSSGYGLLVFMLILTIWCFKELPAGFPFAMTAVFYSIFRFLEEMYRSQKEVIFKLFSPAQIFSLLLLLIGTGSLFYLHSFTGNSYYEPLIYSITPALFSKLEYPLLLLLGLISIFVFSYHRKEIGKWF